MNSARIKAYLALATAALIWGAAQPLIKPALSFVTPVQYMMLRYLMALPLGIVVLLVMLRKFRPSRLQLLKIMTIELIALVNLAILYTGLQYTTALQSALILNARPIFITLMGIWMLKEREETHEWIGLLLSITGIVLVVMSPYFNGIPFASVNHRGNMIIVLTNVIYMLTTYFSKRTYKEIPKPFVTAVNSIYGCLFFTVLTLGIYGHLPLASLTQPAVLLPVVYMGLFGTLLASSLSIYGYLNIEASEAALFNYLEPLVYIPLAVYWLNEPILPLQMLGLVTVIAGVAVAATRFPRHKRLPFLRHGIASLRTLTAAEEPAPLPNNLSR